LLWIAEQHDTPGRRRDCEHIRQRHLTRLVNEQYIDCCRELRPRPKPGGSRPDLGLTALQLFEDLAVVVRMSYAGVFAAIVFVWLLDNAQFRVRLGRRFANRSEEVGDHLVTVGGNPDALAGLY